MKTMKMKTMIAIAITLSVIIGLGLLAVRPKMNALAAGGTLCLRVNPEIAVHYNADGDVTKVEARNDDGTAILDGYAGYEGKETGMVITELISAIGEAGYFLDEVEGEGRKITLELEAGSRIPNDTFLQEVLAQVQKCVSENNWAAPVKITVEDDVNDKDDICTNVYCDDDDCDDTDCDDNLDDDLEDELEDDLDDNDDANDKDDICTNVHCDDDDCDDTDCDDNVDDDQDDDND